MFFNPRDLVLWPMTLTFKVNLDGIQFHPHAEFRDPIFNSSWDMIFGLGFFCTGGQTECDAYESTVHMQR